jgi:Fe2+ transport system protein FeoA
MQSQVFPDTLYGDVDFKIVSLRISGGCMYRLRNLGITSSCSISVSLVLELLDILAIGSAVISQFEPSVVAS